MFIERASFKRFLLAPAERNGSPTCLPLPETLRSAGARFAFTTISINIRLRWSLSPTWLRHSGKISEISDFRSQGRGGHGKIHFAAAGSVSPGL